MRRRVAFGVVLLSGVVTHASGCGVFLDSGDDELPPRPSADTDAASDGNAATVDGATGENEAGGGSDGGGSDGEAGVIIDGAVDGAGSPGAWKCTLVTVSSPEDDLNTCNVLRKKDPDCDVTAGTACTVGEPDRGSCDPCTTSYPFQYKINACTCQ